MSSSEWREVKVSEIGKIVTGKTPKTAISENYGGNIPFLTPSDDMNIKKVKSTARTLSEMGLNSVKNCLLPAKSICVSCIGSDLGKVVLTSEPTVTNQQINSIVPDEKFDPDFIYYGMTILGKHLNYLSKTSTAVPIINKTTFSNFSIIVPSIEEQKAIAHILSTLDDKIEVNNQINKTLENMAQAYFDDMFPNVAAGDTTIGEYITPKRGKNLLSKDAISGEVPVIAGGLSPATYHNVSNTQSPVITISASGANAGFVNLWTVPVWSSDSSFIDYEMTKDVYFWYVMLKKRQKEIYDSQTGSAQPHIYPKHITIMPTIKLNVDEINLYTKRVTPLFKKIANNLYEISKLQLIRDTLLPKLMSGEIRVPLDEECEAS